MKNDKDVTIIGAGVSGLFCSYLLLEKGFNVSLYDQMSGVGKKFLVAGHGGLNLTHSEDLEAFASRYGKNKDIFYHLLKDFSPNDLRQWALKLGVETFVGSSGRVFPKQMNAAEFLRSWLNKLKEHQNFKLNLNHKLMAINNDKILFEHNNKKISIKKGQFTILALGGASWKKTGSDGLWSNALHEHNIKVSDFSAMNCGFECDWSEFIKNIQEPLPLKNIRTTHLDHTSLSEIMITNYGVEGGAIYALSRSIQEEIQKNDQTNIMIDLVPQFHSNQILEKLNKHSNKKVSLSNILRKSLKIDKTKFLLLREFYTNQELNDFPYLSKVIKEVPITLIKARPIDEAISTGGGISFEEIDSNFLLMKLPNTFVCGEMIDWDAPTGGYLLQGCFSSAFRVVKAIVKS